ncbi:amidohydrolase [Trichococcus collinsii]|uniref:Cytosine/adenosine deaminase n=1 Tax=Trichococcus collinsii TaxID=157076 RepID=A0AB38A3C2_9LACT|nr:amidohydrolase [Trichococcus collinsii]SEA89017.1 Cytosine/adenosine deaminase [Trichococcus collinsii]
MNWIWNVRLETGESVDSYGRVQTETGLFHLKVDDQGIVIEISDAENRKPDGDGFDAKQKLALPAFKELHNHLDKTYLSLEWKASRPSKNLDHRLEMEAAELTELAKTTEQRAQTMIERHLKNGVNHIRTHVNIDPFIRLENLKGVKKALDKYQEYITYDIVAFPQHGLLRHAEVPDLLRQALQSGATMLGALDPGGIDKNIEASLQITMDIAKEYQSDVDFHLHDSGHLGYYTMDHWLRMVEQQGYGGKTSFSHAFGLNGIGESKQRAFAKRLKDNNVQILTTVPISLQRKLIPIDLLTEAGVFVGMGCDGFYDSWSPCGSGDVLERVKEFCGYTGKNTERKLRESLAYITEGVTPLDQDAAYQWPKVGDEASFVLLNASCSAEAVARASQSQERILINKGKIYSP